MAEIEARTLRPSAGCTRFHATADQRPIRQGGEPMAWTTPTLVEICIGLEINGYLPAEF